MPEETAFEQIRRHARAIERKEGFALARRFVVDELGYGFLAGSAFPVYDNTRIIVRCDLVDFRKQFLVRLAFARELTSAIALEMIHELAFGGAPVLFRIIVRDMSDGHAIGDLVLIVPVSIHGCIEQSSTGFVISAARPVSCEWNQIIERKIEQCSGSLQQAVLVHINLHRLFYLGSSFGGNLIRERQGTDPEHADAVRFQAFEGSCEAFRVTSQTDAEDHNRAPNRGLQPIQKFGKPSCAHAQDVGILEMSQGERRSTGVIRPAPASQNQVVRAHFHFALSPCFSSCQYNNFPFLFFQVLFRKNQCFHLR